jgi:hypothetical protein
VIPLVPVVVFDWLVVEIREPDLAFFSLMTPCASLQCVAEETPPVSGVFGDVDDCAAAVSTPLARNADVSNAILNFIRGTPLEPDSELYVERLDFGPASRLSMMHIIASLA